MPPGRNLCGKTNQICSVSLGRMAGRLANAVGKLAPVFFLVEGAARFENESVRAEFPAFETTDANFVIGAAGAGVGAEQCPVVVDGTSLDDEVVEEHGEVGEGGHELRSSLCDSCAADRWRATVNRERAVGVVEGGDPCGVFAAPSGGVAHCEIGQFNLVRLHGRLRIVS